MTDREMLELAAKAAGIIIDHAKRDPSVTFFRNDRGLVINWNPITDDGDALRLAVKLGLIVCCGENEWGKREAVSGVPYNKFGFASAPMMKEPIIDDDLYAATRRAIVRAAAKIGEKHGN